MRRRPYISLPEQRRKLKDMPTSRAQLKPGDLGCYVGDVSFLSKHYEPDEGVVKDPSGEVKRGDVVMVISVMPKEAFVLNSRMEIGWLVTTFLRKVT